MSAEALNLLVEIGTEEIPASYLKPATEALRDGLAKLLVDHGLAQGEWWIKYTPRRLVVGIDGVATAQESRESIVTGPAWSASFGADGQATKAALGFAQGQGKTVADLFEHSPIPGKPAKAALRVFQQGRATIDILAEALPKLLAGLPFPKSMRWGTGNGPFARPVRWIVALLGAEIIPFEFAGVRAGRESQGHRYLGQGPFAVHSPHQWLGLCRENGVEPDFGARCDRIRAELKTLAGQLGLQAPEDEPLVEENANLCEWPVVLPGEFEENFLDLPEEIIVGALKKHLRCFVLRSPDGRLSNRFAVVANHKPPVAEVVSAGYARVVRARLSDARFVVEEDAKSSLAAWATALDRVTFHRLLGSIGDKVRRVRHLAVRLARRLELDSECRLLVERAAMLCKADLASRTVFEFPELQGAMGRYFALKAGEHPRLAEALADHWRPRFSGDAPPADVVGRIVALADKLDTLTACWAAGLEPTSAKDAFGLRRQTLGILAILAETGWPFTVAELVGAAVGELPQEVRAKAKRPLEETQAQIIEFAFTRLCGQAEERGVPPDVIAAARAPGFTTVPDAYARIQALHSFTRHPDYEALAVAFKRAQNILAKQGQDWLAAGRPKPDATRFSEDAERGLWLEIKRLAPQVRAAREARDYASALATIAGLRTAVDRFFEQVRVQADDAATRVNRLALLDAVRELCADIADFTKIQAG